MGGAKTLERGGNRVSIKCAFCNGAGRDPFGLLSVLATCQVCSGRGSLTVTEPIVNCAFCNGSGVHPSRRYTCIVCNGRGVVPAPAEGKTEECPECRGNGKSRHWNVPCLKCKGKGFIATGQG